MSYAIFNRSAFPLIVVSFTGENETPDNFKEYLNGLLKNYEAKKPFSLVFDATKASTPNIKYQKLQAMWMKEHDSLVKEYCRCVAYVVPSVLLRGVLKTIFRLQKNPVPFKVFSNLDDAKNWAREAID